MTITEWATIIGTVISFIVAIGSLVVSFSQRRKNSADAGETSSRSVGLLLEPLNKRIDTLTEELDKANKKIAKVESERESERERYRIEREEAERIRKQENKEREEERIKMQSEIDEMRGGFIVLNAQLEGAGITPRYKPKTAPLSESKT